MKDVEKKPSAVEYEAGKKDLDFHYGFLQKKYNLLCFKL